MILLDESTFDDFVENSESLIQFSAKWCNPCKLMTNTIKSCNFKNINKFGQFNITNYNHNFFINWRSQFKQLIKEKIKKNYI